MTLKMMMIIIIIIIIIIVVVLVVVFMMVTTMMIIIKRSPIKMSFLLQVKLISTQISLLINKQTNK